MITVRDVLEELSDASLRRLCERRVLSPRRGRERKISQLARSYRGDFDALTVDLRVEELIEVLSAEWVSSDGRTYTFSNLQGARKEQLVAVARLNFDDDWEPGEDGERPLHGSSIAVSIVEGAAEETEETYDVDEDLDDEGDVDEEDADLEEDDDAVAAILFSSDRYRDEFWDEIRFRPGEMRGSRTYQIEAIHAAMSQLLAGRSALLHIATGGGKTWIANDTVMRWLVAHPGSEVLWLAKDWRLLYQAARDIGSRHGGMTARLGRMGGDSSMIAPLPEGAGDASVVYSTLHTFARRQTRRGVRRPSLIVWDETHWGETGAMGTRLRGWAARHGIPILALTATPRQDTFDVAYRIEFPELVGRGFLARPVRHEPLQTGVSWRARRGGPRADFTVSSLRHLGENRRRNEFIADHYANNARQYGPTIVFACSVRHANTLADLLQARGIAARPVHSHLDPSQNRAAVDDFEQGRVTVLLNVAMLTTGVDFPSARTVFLCRPTLSDILYSQMVGRAARIDPSTGKTEFNVVEFVDVSQFHEILLRPRRFYAGVGGARSSGDRRTGEPRPRYTFDPTGAPFLLPDREDVPDALRGLWLRHGQTFGVEIELTSDDYGRAMSHRVWTERAAALLAALRNALPMGTVASVPIGEYVGCTGEKDHSVWNVERDHSAGWEVTSRVLVNEAGCRELAAACAAIESVREELGLRLNFQTGMHIHIGWLGGSVDEVKRAIYLAKWFEPAIATLVSPSRLASFAEGRYRLGTPNPYCRPVSSVFPRRALGGVRTLAEILELARSDGGRYVSFNILPLEHIHTVEVRLHNGTTDASKILLWLSLWQQILWAATHRPFVHDVEDREAIEPNGDLQNLARSYLPEGTDRFQWRLTMRQREVVAGWSRHPDLNPWLRYARGGVDGMTADALSAMTSRESGDA